MARIDDEALDQSADMLSMPNDYCPEEHCDLGGGDCAACKAALQACEDDDEDPGSDLRYNIGDHWN